MTFQNQDLIDRLLADETVGDDPKARAARYNLRLEAANALRARGPERAILTPPADGYTATARADLVEKIKELGSDFPNYATWNIGLPAGHWRSLLPVLDENKTTPENPTLAACLAIVHDSIDGLGSGDASKTLRPYLTALKLRMERAVPVPSEQMPSPERRGWYSDINPDYLPPKDRLFTDAEKQKLRPIAETLAMLDGNAFFTMEAGDGRAWHEGYLPEAYALYQANGGDTGWAGEASFAKAALTEHPMPLAVWQPIETAPKDGTQVLLYTGKAITPTVFAGCWLYGDWTHGLSQSATHWAPLPPAPVPSQTMPVPSNGEDA